MKNRPVTGAYQVDEAPETGCSAESARRLVLRRSELQEVQIGAALLALLAYPLTSEAPQRSALGDALFGQWVQNGTKTWSEDVAAAWRRDFPEACRMSAKTIKQGLRTSKRRWRDRAVAARMASGFLREALSGEPAPLPESMQGVHNLRALSELVQKESGQGIVKQVERRTWAESRPVLHLATAYRAVDTELFGKVGNRATPLLELPEYNDRIVATAMRDAQLMEAEPRIRTRPGELWQIDLSE